MRKCFNTGNEVFRIDSNDAIYVDKTGLLQELNRVVGTSKCCVALSHARRFGKSQAACMLEAYYSCGCDSKELFFKFAIAKTADFEKHLNKYNVIRMDISTFLDSHKEDLVEFMTKTLIKEFKEEYPQIDYEQMISYILCDIYEISGKQFVIILDEWDCVIRNCSDDQDLVHRYLQFLHELFKSIESRTYLALGYITGIMPIKKIQNESALNNFKEYTMLSSGRLAPYFGFTEEEVRVLCDKFSMNFESVKKWYDGYIINGLHMYNPNSVYEAMERGELASYWKNTASFETINDYIALNLDGLKDAVLEMLDGGHVFVNTNTFANDLSIISSKDEALTALIHLGYLGYDAETSEAFIPNFEVSLAFYTALSVGSWKEIAQTISKSEELLQSTIRMKADRVAELVELAHDAYTSILKYNDENSLSCAVTMAYFTAPAYYNIVREFPAGKGFADIVMLPRADVKRKPAIVIELKWNQSADTAIKQIKERRYAGSLTGYAGDVLLVGISYDKDSKNKRHQCVIEKISI